MKRRFALLLAAMVCFGAAAEPTPVAVRESRYRLHPGDSIKVAYHLTPEYDATVAIQPDGFAVLPLLGDLKLSGLTLPEVRTELQTKAAERLIEPELTVDLQNFEQPSYIVGGEVAAPGRFPIRGRVTAVRAVALAGGIKTSGKSSQVLLIRPVNDVDGETLLIDLRKVIDKQQINEDVELRAGDVLIVPKNRTAKVKPVMRLFNPLSY